MAPRLAALIIADEVYYNLHGKAILQGIYNTDLIIPVEPTQAPQLIFYFIIETDISEPFESLKVEVTLPGSAPHSSFVLVPPPQFLRTQAETQKDRSRWYTRFPLLIPAPQLRPGKIEARVIHEKGEIPVTTHWIVLNPAFPPRVN